jgi:hypothetical protein
MNIKGLKQSGVEWTDIAVSLPREMRVEIRQNARALHDAMPKPFSMGMAEEVCTALLCAILKTR